MYARSTTIKAKPESIDRGLTYMRDEVMPAVLGVDGCFGLSVLVDRLGGRCIATSAWRSKEAMDASEERMRPLRRLAAEHWHGAAEVDCWEIAVMHRDHTSNAGACVRATWLRVAPAQLDRAADVFRMVSVPAMDAMDGFCSASLMLQRDTGLMVSSVTFDSRVAMEGSRKLAASARESAMREVGVQLLDVCEFELAEAHLRVPELA